MMASMRNWLCGGGDDNNDGTKVAVVHCKAGKGRSGTVVCSYLISQQGWSAQDALNRFTERRMRVGFGPGVSIPSQLRWVEYVDRWTNELGKTYVERPVEILEIHLWGLRDGLKVEVEGYVDEGQKIKRFHRFHGHERTAASGDEGTPPVSHDDQAATSKDDEDKAGYEPADAGRVSDDKSSASFESRALTPPEPITKTVASFSGSSNTKPSDSSAVVLRPRKRIVLPTSDVNIDFERRSVASYTSWTVVTSVAHVWFNAYFEGGNTHDSGVFEAGWDSLDGIKGTPNKGTRSVDRIKVVWRYPSPPPPANGEEAAEAGGAPGAPLGRVVSEPRPGEAVQEGHAADWRGQDAVAQGDKEELPLHAEGLEANNSHTSSQLTHEASGKSREPSSLGSWSMTAGKSGARRQSTPRTNVSLVNATGSVDAGRSDDPKKLAESSSDSNDSDSVRAATSKSIHK